MRISRSKKNNIYQIVRHLTFTAAVFVSLFLIAEPTAISAQDYSDINFPADFSTFVNVKTGYGARGDGYTDDTAALQRAISENVGTTRILYFPNGVYLISNRLEWRRPHDAARPWSAFLTLMGQNRNSTVIRLRENASGYDDANNPRAVVFTASDDFTPRDQTPRHGYLEAGIGNEAFGNYVENLTIDTGGNRGAVGIDYLASNTGAIRNVTVRGQGVAGVALIRGLQGPELIKNLTVEGFDYGVLARDAVYAATLENIRVSNQRVAGIANQGQIALSIRGLTSVNQVPAVQNLDALSLVDLIDANLTGGAAQNSAIENAGQMLARNIVTGGYQSAIKHRNSVVSGVNVAEWVSATPFNLFDSPAKSLNLPIEDAPEFHDQDFNNWANVVGFGANPDDLWNDDTQAIQAALNSGKATVYLPHGVYSVGQTLRVPPAVKRIIGGDWGIGWGAFADANNPQPLLRIEGAATEPLIIERLSVSRKHNGSPLHRGLLLVEHQSPRTVVLKDITTLTDRIFGAYRSAAGAGKLFIENVAASQFFFDHPQKVWARQLNPENLDELRIRNNAATLWILGIKTEGYGSIIETNQNGTTELLGGNLFSTTPPIYALPPAFINNNGRVSLSYTTTAYAPWTADFPVHVAETRGAETRRFTFNDAVWRGFGRIVPLFVGYQNASGGGNSQPFGGAARVLPGLIEAEDFDEGGANIAYRDADAGNNGGSNYRTGDVDVRENRSETGATKRIVGWTNGGESLKYTVNVQRTGNYNLQFKVASAQNGGALHIEDENGANLSGAVAFGGTGGWDNFRIVVKRNVRLTAGIKTLRVVFETGGFDLDWWQISKFNVGIVPDGIYEIEPSHAPGMRLNVAGNGDHNGADADIRRDANHAGQRWQVTQISDGWYEISPLAAAARRLDLYGFGTWNGTDIRLWQSTGGANQRWQIESVADDLYEFAPQFAAHLRMDVSGFGTHDGSNVHAWSPTGNGNQRWRLLPQ